MEFDRAVEIILDLEKGLVNHAKDPGGLTNFGISQRAYPSLDIASLTREKASEIYFKDYWEKNKIQEVDSFLRLMVFDCCVNQGPSFALRIYNDLGVVKGPGPLSLQALKDSEPKEVLKRYTFKRLDRYIENTNFSIFGAGWTRRLFEVLFLSLGDE
jgi:lysozyme family protein